MSPVDISNLALGHLGDDAMVSAIDPPDGSVQAGHCGRFYPFARDALLEMHPWRFSTQRAVLTPSTVPPPVGWAFAYAMPAIAVKPLAILLPTLLTVGSPDVFSTLLPSAVPTGIDTLNSQDYVVEMDPIDGTPVIYTNVDQALILYSVRVTDTTKFGPLFNAALARLLASYLAGPIIKGVTGANVAREQLAIFEKVDFPAAVASDANQRQSAPYTNAMPAAIVARM